jgi:hypothetical protein
LNEEIFEARKKVDDADIKYRQEKFDAEQGFLDYKAKKKAATTALEAGYDKEQVESIRDIAAIRNETSAASTILKLEEKQKFQVLEIELLKATAQAEVDVKMAIQPKLIEALQGVAATGQLKVFAEMLPLELIENLTFDKTIKRFFNGSPAGKEMLEQFSNRTNG